MRRIGLILAAYLLLITAAIIHADQTITIFPPTSQQVIIVATQTGAQTPTAKPTAVSCAPWTIGFVLSPFSAPSCIASPTPTATMTPAWWQSTPTPSPTPTTSQTATQTPTPTATPTPFPLDLSSQNQYNTLPFVTSEYMSPNGSSATTGNVTTENLVQSPVSGIRTLKNLYCNASVGMSGGNSVQIIMRDAGADTNLGCTIASGSSTCNDTTHAPTTAAGDMLSYRIVASPGATPTTTPVPFTLGCSIGR